MTDPFARTLQTAKDKDIQAKVLDRAVERAKQHGAYEDAHKLAEMARECRDYAQALRETAATGAPADEVDGVQEGLL